VLLIGYSKGAPDALAMIAQYPETAGRVRAVVSWAGAAGGSHLADTAAPLLEDLDVEEFLTGPGGRVLRRFVPATSLGGLTRREDEFDVPGAIGDLRTGVRRGFLDEHRPMLDDLGVPFMSVAGAVRVRDVPYFQALAALQLAGHERLNDMQVTESHTRVPVAASAHLGTLRAHHWDMAYDAFPEQLRMRSRRLGLRFHERWRGATLALLAETGLIE
jgi:hypothetical protein